MLEVLNEFEFFEFNHLGKYVDSEEGVQSFNNGLIESECIECISSILSEFSNLYYELDLLERRLENQRMYIQDAKFKLKEEKVDMSDNNEKENERVKLPHKDEILFHLLRENVGQGFASIDNVATIIEVRNFEDGNNGTVVE